MSCEVHYFSPLFLSAAVLLARRVLAVQNKRHFDYDVDVDSIHAPSACSSFPLHWNDCDDDHDGDPDVQTLRLLLMTLVSLTVLNRLSRSGSSSSLVNGFAFGIVSRFQPVGAGWTSISRGGDGGNGRKINTSAKNGDGVGYCSASSCIKSSVDKVTSSNLMSSSKVTHPAYELLSTTYVKEYGVYCTMYKHIKSGAELMSVVADDDNKVFGITFRTPPADSTGVPHIVEHSVLCGSRKYQTKEPFVELIKGSLNTFLNAFTYPDRTCYPVASQNTKDFYNLVNVYMDAVLHPRAATDPMVHAQEGWHYELENRDDPLTYKGVVFNEMKGVYSSPDSLLSRESMRSLFPDNTYAVDSGGDPKNIPDLSFEDFSNFHAKTYSPCNSRIFFYGDDDVSKRLELANEYLKDFNDNGTGKDSVIEWQKKTFENPLRETVAYPASPDSPQTHMLNVNWLLNDVPLSDYEILALNVLDHLLLATPSSVLRKAMMESGLGDSVTGGGLSDELLQATFSIGLKGVEKQNVENVEKLITDTINKIISEGFPDDAIAASLNSVEFSLREFNTGSFPKGLSMMLGSMSKWIYDGDPTSGIKFESALAKLKQELSVKKGGVFTELMTDYFVKNKHRSIIEMVPSVTLEADEVQREKEILEKVKASMTKEDLDEIISTTKELKRLQALEDPAEAIATIPSLTLADLDREVKEYPIEVEVRSLSYVHILVCTVFDLPSCSI